MSTDDATLKSVILTPLKSNNQTPKSTDSTPATSEEESPANVGQSDTSAEAGTSELAVNGEVKLEAKDTESHDTNGAVEVANGELKVAADAVDPLSEPFVGSGDSAEAIDPTGVVLAWSPEEDHEHKRVKVRSCGPFGIWTFHFMTLINFTNAVILLLLGYIFSFDHFLHRIEHPNAVP